MVSHSRLFKIVASLGLATSLIAASAGTASAAPPTGSPHAVRDTAAPPPPTGASPDGNSAMASQRTSLAPRRLMPQRPLDRTPHVTKPKRAAAKKADAMAAAQSCQPSDFSSRSGSALVSYVKGSTTNCISSLFNVTGGDAHGVFQQSQMVTIANALGAAAASYTGDNSTGVSQLEYFLRAGYYVQYYDPTDVGSYDGTLSSAVQSALDTFFASPYLLQVSDANGAIVGDVVILTDSANLQDHYLGVYKRLLNAYDSSWDSSVNMDNVIYDVYTPLWRGQWNTAFVSAVTADTSIFTTLYDFALSHTNLLGGDNTFLDANAGLDLALYVQFPALQSTVRPLISGILANTSMTGQTAALWVSTANQASYYDQANCSSYGICNLADKLTAAVLPSVHSCDSVRTIQAQSLSASDLDAVCTSLQDQDPFFHNLVKDSGPIPNQNESTYRLIVFKSRLDYQIYAPAIYGVDTNNGGITLVGDPTQAGNQPKSLMYQDPTDDGFTANIWNLNHEYTHILDARYDTPGDFTEQISVPDVWWIEGLAEYVSYSYRQVPDTAALQVAPEHTYALSTIFQNTYDNSDTTKIYYWGYLAVRYMFEKHPDVVASMLDHFRTGDYQGGYQVYNSIGTAYDADFDAWLDTLGSSTGTGAPTAAFTSSVSGLDASFTNTSTESGSGTISSWDWNFGDGSGSTAQNPTHTYAAAGTYTVTLSATDSNGKTSTATHTVTVSASSGSLPTCTSSDPRVMGQNCSRPGQSATEGNEDYLYLYLPAGTTTLTVSTSGGTGDADLYYSPSSWATPDNYTARSTGSGNSESITVTNTTAGYRYISLHAVTDFDGVTVTTQY